MIATLYYSLLIYIYKIVNKLFLSFNYLNVEESN